MESSTITIETAAEAEEFIKSHEYSVIAFFQVGRPGHVSFGWSDQFQETYPECAVSHSKNACCLAVILEYFQAKFTEKEHLTFLISMLV